MTDHKLLQLLRTDRNKGMTLLIREYSGLVFSVVRGILADICDSRRKKEQTPSDLRDHHRPDHAVFL